MPPSAEYLITQYLRNPVRREPRNVGIIVILGDSRSARFSGEVSDTGEIDGRSTKWVAHPSVYRKWVKYWREQLRKDGDGLAERLAQTNGGNYDVIRGGFVTDYGNDSPQMICENLFVRLVETDETAPVSVGRAESDLDTSSRAFEAQVATTFRQLGIMHGHQLPTVRHPILHNVPVAGTRMNHTPQFCQYNGHLCVMESLNFSTSRRLPIKHHAGYMAKMFDDIANNNSAAERVAMIHVSREDMEDRTVKYSRDLLSDSARLVNWLDLEERDVFLTDRQRMALNDGPTTGLLK